MLAIRDQENRIHERQTAEAAKAQKQAGTQRTIRGQPPKTPLRVPLNDENDRKTLLLGKSMNKAPTRGNENVQFGAKDKGGASKEAFKTPMGPRAPLGQKTTNAKARAFQTPGPVLGGGDDLTKAKQRSASARKKGPRISHVEPVRIDVLSDKALEDDMDIGVIHARPRDLPDTPDDLPDIDLSILGTDLTASMMRHIYNEPGADGLSILQRKQKRDAEQLRLVDAHDEAMMKRSIELHSPMPCTHMPLCESDECRDEPERRRQIEAEFQQTLQALYGKENKQLTKLASKTTLQRTITNRQVAAPMPKATVLPTKNSGVRLNRNNAAPSAPSNSLSKEAATKLSLSPSASQLQLPKVRTVAPTTARAPSAKTAQKAPTASTTNTNTNASRYAAARQASRSTMGYAQGRAVSGSKRPSVLPRSDMDVFRNPSGSEYGEDEHGPADAAAAANESIRQSLVQDALDDDFQFALPE